MAQFETLTLEHVDMGVALITMNRPASANALNTRMGQELLEQFRSILMDPGDLRCGLAAPACDFRTGVLYTHGLPRSRNSGRERSGLWRWHGNCSGL